MRVSDLTACDAIPGVKLKAVSGSDEYEGTTDGNGTVKFEHIPFGAYDVYETEVPDGYALSTLKTNVSITKEKPLYTLNLQKMKLADILGTLNVQFLDADSKAGIRNAKFALYRDCLLYTSPSPRD